METDASDDGRPAPTDGSIVVPAGTDAAPAAGQLRRCTSRAALGLARTGAIPHHGSGNIAVGFTTDAGETYDDTDLTPLLGGVVEAAEEAVDNPITRAETTSGTDGTTAPALPAEAVSKAVSEAGSD